MERHVPRDAAVRGTAEGISGLSNRPRHRHRVASLSRMSRAPAFSRQKTRPSHPNADPRSRAAWLKKLPAALTGAAKAIRTRRIATTPIGQVARQTVW
jgi:hypothetical protein